MHDCDLVIAIPSLSLGGAPHDTGRPTAPCRPRPRCLEEVRGRPNSKANRLPGFKAKKREISALKNCQMGHHWRMSNDFKSIVYFSCPHCATIHGEPARAVRATPRLLSLPCVRCACPRTDRAL